MRCAYAKLYCHLWPVWLYHVFLVSHISLGHDFRGKKKALKIKFVFWYSLQHFFLKNFIPRIIQRDGILNVHPSSYEVPTILSGFHLNWIFITNFWKTIKYQFNKNPYSGSRVFTYPQTDREGGRQAGMTQLIVNFAISRTCLKISCPAFIGISKVSLCIFI